MVLLSFLLFCVCLVCDSVVAFGVFFVVDFRGFVILIVGYLVVLLAYFAGFACVGLRLSWLIALVGVLHL